MTPQYPETISSGQQNIITLSPLLQWPFSLKELTLWKKYKYCTEGSTEKMADLLKKSFRWVSRVTRHSLYNSNLILNGTQTSLFAATRPIKGGHRAYPSYLPGDSGVPRGGFGGGGSNPHPPPKYQRPSKIVPNSTWLQKLIKITEFRMPTPQDVPKKGSEILKLPPVCNCFTLAMTNKLVVIINSLKVPKIKKLSLCEIKFLVQNYSCLQNPWLGGYCPQIPALSVLNWIC